MTVSTTLNKIIYPGNASATVFPFTFDVPAGTLTQQSAQIQVYFTNTSGVVSLLAPTAYILIVNPPTGTNPTPVGGSVTYNPGSPIPFGSFLTILRALPLQQNTSLANQGTLWQPVVEEALDYEMMTSQQILEIQNRALVVSVSDPTPGPVPAVAARAGLFFTWDSSGNPTASAGGGANSPVSSAMAPVVAAATLAAGRTAFGLGAMATEGIGAGLQDDGAGNARVVFGFIADAVNQSVVAGFDLTRRQVFAPITYTFPLSSTLFPSFGFWIQTNGFAVTLAINASDNFVGAPTGQGLTLPPGVTVFVQTNAAGAWFIDFGQRTGLNAPLNLQLNATVASNALTIAIKDWSGNDPTPSSPVLYTVSAGGNSVTRAITTPLSITVPVGATLGTVSGLPNRIWVGVFDGVSGPVLGVYNSLLAASSQIVAWDESVAPSPTGISAGSTSTQTWYAATSQTSRAFRIIGYIESTQATAGTWATAPSKVQLFGPGQKKPGDLVKCQFNSGSTSVPLSLVSPCNVVKVEAQIGVEFLVGASSNTFAPAIFRGGTQITSNSFNFTNTGVSYTVFGSLASLSAFDVPGASATYSINFGAGNSGGMTINGGNMNFSELFI